MISWVWSFMIFRREVNMLSGIICNTFSEREKRKNKWTSYFLSFSWQTLDNSKKGVHVLKKKKKPCICRKGCWGLCSFKHELLTGYTANSHRNAVKDVSLPHYKFFKSWNSEVLGNMAIEPSASMWHRTILNRSLCGSKLHLKLLKQGPKFSWKL